MTPDKPGYYWIKSLDYDGTGGKSVSDWYPAYYESALSWEIIGSECGIHADNVVQIGPELTQFDED